ncbi:hypothetical protein LCGC14_1579070 [marine sediment metagenome]|uniref:Uncharacterized protein n=1 Tax=marine sediment metagenome TaxID=412755 RepID=A0A0F9LHM0_9ZZZZ
MNGHNQEVLDSLDAPPPDEEEWPPVSNCCGAPPAYGLTPEETDLCGRCGEHCTYEEE